MRTRNKYGAVKVKDDGITFDSKLEHKRYRELKLLQSAGKIRNLRVHVRHELDTPTGPIGKYEVDFQYEEPAYKGPAWEEVFEDCKGVMTPLSKWKIKHFESQYFCIVNIIRK